MQNDLKEELEIIYEDALDYLYEKTVFTIDFPEQCPYEFKQLLDKTWFPS